MNKIDVLLPIVRPSRQQLLSLANARPWSRNGGLQHLANIVKKPIIAEAGPLRQEFIPSTRIE